MKKGFLLAALCSILLLSSYGVVLAAPGGKSPASAELTVKATINENSTDIVLKVVPVDPGQRMPSQWKHLQVKAFDSNGKLKFTENSKDIPVYDSQFTLHTDKLKQDDKVQVMVLVQGIGGGSKTEVLSEETTVLRVPDLTLNYDAYYQFHDIRDYTDFIVENDFRTEKREQHKTQILGVNSFTVEAFEPAGTTKVTVRSGDEVLHEMTLTDVAYNTDGRYQKFTD